jgi:nucleotidyltransferase/DNA polymerase involved in DNA repair
MITSEPIDWFAACYQLTPRVERLNADHALLDLGYCTEAEALSALHTLLNHLAQAEVHVLAGIGPTPVVAQLAAQMSSPAHPQGRPLLVSASATLAFLKPLPIECLLNLRPSDAVTVETLMRLQRSGIRTIGQLARFDELTLRRQFGAAGGCLAAIAQGKSLYPFTPTPRPRALRFGLRHADPLTADAIQHQLARLAAEMAQTLDEEGRAAGHMTLAIHWASGAHTCLGGSFRWRIHNPRILTWELTRLIIPELRRRPDEQIDAIRCILSDLERPLPSQDLLWPHERTTQNDRRWRSQAVADALAQRSKRPTLLNSRRVAGHAIFSEDGYALMPLSTSHTPANDTASRAHEQRATAQRTLGQQDAPLRLYWR